jgi:methyl-accepting chemotaxis protein
MEVTNSQSSALPVQVSESNLFLIAFGTGCFGMLLFKLFFGTQQIYITLVPLLVMLAYFRHAKQQLLESSRPERAGDNVYYLGFLFTLVSLALALYGFESQTEGRGHLIADFAIALATTIAGVLGRVWLSQGKLEVDDYEAKARVHLHDAVEELRTQLSTSRESMRQFAAETLVMLSTNRDQQEKELRESSALWRDQMLDKLKAVATDMHESVSASSGLLAQALSQANERISTEATHLTTYVADLAKSAKKLGTAMERAAATIEQIPPPGEEIKQKIEALGAPIIAAASMIERLARAQQEWATKLEVAFGATHRTGEAVQRVLEGVSQGGVDLAQRVAASGASITETITGVQAETDRMRDVIHSAGEGMRKMLEIPPEVISARSEFVRHVETLGELASRFNDSVITLAGNFDQRSATLGQAIQREDEVFSALTAKRTQVNNSFTHLDQEINATLQSLRTRLDELSTVLIGLARFIATSQAPAVPAP